MTQELILELLSGLGKSRKQEFNVFNVMHHGTHEKQISNIFKWLLDDNQTHNLKDSFAKIFIKETSCRSKSDQTHASEGYIVRQEVNTALPGKQKDIADLVFETDTDRSDSTRIVIENYFTDDGHGHSYDNYKRYSKDGYCIGEVVLLCRTIHDEPQGLGWENATVIPYYTLIDQLYCLLKSNSYTQYRQDNNDAYRFIEQMHIKYGKEGKEMKEKDDIEFIVAMCDIGEAERYGWNKTEEVAVQLAENLMEQAQKRFISSRERLGELKTKLKDFCQKTLMKQLNEELNKNFICKVSASYQGNYQWTINLDIMEGENEYVKEGIQLAFGPSAWKAIEEYANWTHPSIADYTHIFLLYRKIKKIKQSTITLQEVLKDLDPNDTRLCEQILSLIKP